MFLGNINMHVGMGAWGHDEQEYSRRSVERCIVNVS